MKEENMKVLIISHMYPSTFNSITGIFVQEQVKELTRQGCDIKVISPQPFAPFPIDCLRPKWKAYSKIPLREEREGISIYYPRYLTFPKSYFFEYSGYFMYWGIKKILREIYRYFPFNLIHAHTLLPDGFAGILARTKINVPLIITIHGSDLLIYPHRNKRIFSHTLKVLSNASRIITVSAYLRNKCYNEFNVPEGKIEVIPNGFDHNVFNFEPTNFKISKINNRFIILFVGHIIKTKGIFDLLNAITIIRELSQEIYKRISWVIIGEGSDMIKFRECLNIFDLNNIVKIIGEIPHEKVAEYMKNADFIILPSWSEGLPTVLVEAIGCGLPIIATKVGGIPEIINEEIGVLAQPKNPKDLANKILYALSKTWNRKIIASFGRNYIWAKNAKKMIQVYKEV